MRGSPLLASARRARDWARSLATSRTRSRLRAEQATSLDACARLAPAFEARYRRSLRRPERWETTPFWHACNARLEGRLLPSPPAAFLRDPLVHQLMFVAKGGAWMRDQITFLDETWGRERLVQLAREDAAGDPLLLDAALATSHNRIHHLFHLARYERATGRSIPSVRSVLEWGGGYGSLARVLLRLHGGTPTYTIVDTPLLSALQWLYLSSVLGEDRVHHLVDEGDAIQEGKVNLVPTTMPVEPPRPPDLFVSTWALSECPLSVVERIAAGGWFGAKGLLLAYQRDPDGLFPAARHLGAAALGSGAVEAPVDHIPASSYAFR